MFSQWNIPYFDRSIMQKKFLQNLGFLVLVNLLVKPFYILGIDAEVQNVVGAEEYGNYFALFNFTFLFNILNDLGTTNYNNRNIARNADSIDEFFPRMLGLRVMLLGLFAVATMISGFFIGYSMGQLYLLAFLVLNQGLVATIFFFRSNLAGLHLFKRDSIISVMDRSILIAILGFLLWSPMLNIKFDIRWFVYAQTGAYALTAIIAFIFLKGKLAHRFPSIDQLFNKEIIKKSVPYAVLILLMSLYHRMDTVILERILPDGDIQAGIYAQGFRFLEALNNFSFLFAVLLFPIFSRMIKQGEDIKELLGLATRILLSGVLIISLTCFSFSLEIISWRYDAQVEMATRCFSLLILSAVCHSTVHIYGTLLTSAGELKLLNLLSGITVVINLILNLWLAPLLYAEGSAWAGLLTQLFAALVHVIVVLKVFKLRPDIPSALKFIGLIAFLLLFGQIAHFMPWAWPLKAGVMCVMGLLVAMLLKLIDTRGILRIMNQS